MTTSRELVKQAIKFQGPERIPYELPAEYGSDFCRIEMDPQIDKILSNGIDEWTVRWENLGENTQGQAIGVPIKDWGDLDKLKIPDINDPKRWEVLEGARQKAGDKFLLAKGLTIYQRVTFLRGLENTWMDIYQHPEQLCKLIDILVDMNLVSIKKYKQAGCDGFMTGDDWGLQDRLTISPEKWREIWKPRYARMYDAAHKAGMLTFLHCCGYIVEILDDLIEIGLDVIQMDQQENMGLELLGRKFGGRITFWSPADIQTVMAQGDTEKIRAYCRKMVKHLSRPAGGFIAKYYVDPKGAGQTPQALDAMCDEFLKISHSDKDF